MLAVRNRIRASRTDHPADGSGPGDGAIPSPVRDQPAATPRSPETGAPTRSARLRRLGPALVGAVGAVIVDGLALGTSRRPSLGAARAILRAGLDRFGLSLLEAYWCAPDPERGDDE